jgi:DNA-binding NtrC family response regulator
VITAANGAEGVQAFRQHQHEIAVTVVDMQMPVMNGAEAVRELFAIDPAVEIILTSGYSELTLDPTLAHKTSIAFLQKPYSIDLFVKTIEERIRARQRK